MNGAHIHLLLNHIPILGSIFAFGLLGAGLLFKSRALQYAALVSVIISALFAIPVCLTGHEAEHYVEKMIGVSESAIETHEEQAEIAYWTILMNGAVALGALLAAGRKRSLSVPLLWVNTVILIVVIFLMVRTGYTGGLIHHPEINATSAPEHDEDHHH